ncbi:alcohol dehydrogenase catalytic domain-containing protein [Candidatus Hydrogenedentota bacterium]
MKGLLVESGKLCWKTDLPKPGPDKDESLVRVSLAGICNTDIEILEGYFDFSGIPGHEFVGIVEKSSCPDLVGQRVVGEINCYCGVCDFCLSGLKRHCSNRTVLGILGRNGCFAEYLTLPTRNLHAVPGSVSDTQAVFVEPLAAAFRISEQMDTVPGGRGSAIVLGDGKLGLLVARVLKLHGYDVLTIGHHAEKLALLEQNGIKTSVGPPGSETSAPLIVDCTGNEEALVTAIGLTQPCGTLWLKSTIADNYNINLAPVVVNEISVRGSRCGPFQPALDALADGSIDVSDLILNTYDLADGLNAFDRASQKGALKVLLQPHQDVV